MTKHSIFLPKLWRDDKPTTSHTRLGLRCEAMIMLGFIWILMGMGVESSVGHMPDGLVLLMVPKEVRFVLWVGTGAFAIFAAIRSSRTDWALSGLMIMPLFRFSSYLWAWFLWLLPGYDRGEYKDGWFTAGVYLAMVGFVYFAAHVPPGLMRTKRSPDAERAEARAEHDGYVEPHDISEDEEGGDETRLVE